MNIKCKFSVNCQCAAYLMVMCEGQDIDTEDCPLWHRDLNAKLEELIGWFEDNFPGR